MGVMSEMHIDLTNNSSDHVTLESVDQAVDQTANQTDVDATQASRNEFPLDTLSPPLRQLVSAMAHSYQVSTGLIAPILLGMLSVAAHGRYDVHVDGDWVEPVCLYTAVIAETGERKTGVFNTLLRPILEYQKSINNTIAYDVKISQLRQASLRDHVQALYRRAHNGDETVTREKICAAEREFAAFHVVRPVTLVTNDCTPEALGVLMAENGGTMSLCADEAGVLQLFHGRYSSQANVDLLLQGYCGGYVNTARITREFIEIARAILTVCIMLQPETADILVNRTARSNGLTSRFLFARPESLIGTRSSKTCVIPEALQTQYSSCLHNLLSADTNAVLCLELTDDALTDIQQFTSNLEPDLAPNARLAYMGDWIKKMAGKIIRIAGLLHLADHHQSLSHIENTQISRETMQRAIKIGMYFMYEADRILKLSSKDAFAQIVKKSWCKLIESNKCGTTLTLSDYNALTKHFAPNAGTRKSVLRELERQGRVCLEKGPAPTHGGTPVTYIHLSFRIFQTSQKVQNNII